MSAADDILVAAGPVDVLHRLALAVEPLDAATRRPVPGVRVRPERRGPQPSPGRRPVAAGAGAAEPSGRLVLRHGSGTSLAAGVRVRIDDPLRRWVPRRLDVRLWSLDELRACDPSPDTPGKPGRSGDGTYISPDHRLLRPWLTPGVAYPCPAGTTGVRVCIRLAGEPPPAPVRPPGRVRWPRVEIFGDTGVRVGWAHGDERGEVLVLVRPPGNADALPPGEFPLVLRVHRPDPDWRDPDDPQPDPQPDPGSGPASDPAPVGRTARPDSDDRLRDLHPEPVALQPAPPAVPDLEDDVARGLVLPPGYLPAGDHLITATVGRVVPVPDLIVPRS